MLKLEMERYSVVIIRSSIETDMDHKPAFDTFGNNTIIVSFVTSFERF